MKSAAPEPVWSIVAHASERQDLNRKVMALSDAEVKDQSGDREFVSGPSPAIREVLDRVHKVATLATNVLIQGRAAPARSWWRA